MAVPSPAHRTGPITAIYQPICGYCRRHGCDAAEKGQAAPTHARRNSGVQLTHVLTFGAFA